MATSPSFTVGIIQESVTGDVGKNVDRAEARIREAAEKSAQIVCLQELFNAPYFCKSQKHERFDLAEPIDGPTIERMQKVARELEVVIIVPIFERLAAGVYRNSAAVIDADGTIRSSTRSSTSRPATRTSPTTAITRARADSASGKPATPTSAS